MDEQGERATSEVKTMNDFSVEVVALHSFLGGAVELFWLLS